MRKLLHNKLPTRDNLRKLDCNIIPYCSLCHQHEETLDHLVLTCPVTISIWKYFPLSVAIYPHFETMKDWFGSKVGHRDIRLGIMVTWFLWKMGNARIFLYQPIHPLSLKQKVFFLISELNSDGIFSPSSTTTGPSSGSLVSTSR